MTENIHLTLDEFAERAAKPEDLRFTDDVLFRENRLFDHLNRAFYGDDVPSTRWSRFTYRLAIHRDRVRDAWAVLRGRASID